MNAMLHARALYFSALFGGKIPAVIVTDMQCP